jgi:hypothetical protein
VLSFHEVKCALLYQAGAIIVANIALECGQFVGAMSSLFIVYKNEDVFRAVSVENNNSRRLQRFDIIQNYRRFYKICK